MASGRVDWPKGALEQTLNIALPRGVLVHGKVTEEGSGKPIPGALRRLQHARRAGRPGARACPSIPIPMAHSVSEPSPNRVTSSSGVRTTTYVFQAIGSRMVLEGQPGGGRIYSHAYAALDLKPGMGSQEVNLVLRRGATVEGRVVGPDGQPVREAWIFSRLILDPSREPGGTGTAAITAS